MKAEGDDDGDSKGIRLLPSRRRFRLWQVHIVAAFTRHLLDFTIPTIQ